MAVKRIDTVIQTVAIATSRRVALGGALGGGLATVLTRFAIDDAAARKRRKRKKKCKTGQAKCGKSCVNLATSGANCGICGNACISDECANGVCACSSGEDCPTECRCVGSAEGGSVCSGRATATSCQDNGDCPPGSPCLISISGNRCGEPCFA